MEREETDDLVRVGVTVEGRVQGVCFRMATQKEAERLEVRGWVRNLSDGRVEAVFEGRRAAVEALVAWCRRGPSLARVSGVVVSAVEPSRGEFSGFAIRY